MVDTIDLLSCTAEERGGNNSVFEFECIMKNDYGLMEPIPAAVSCSLLPCVKTYSAVIHNSQYKESVLSTEILRPGKTAFHHDTFLYLDFATVIDPLRDGVRKKCEPSLKRQAPLTRWESRTKSFSPALETTSASDRHLSAGTNQSAYRDSRRYSVQD